MGNRHLNLPHCLSPIFNRSDLPILLPRRHLLAPVRIYVYFNRFILINSAAGFFSGVENVTKAGGAFGIVSPLVHGFNEALTNNQLTAAIAGYTALAGLLTKDTSYFLLPVGDQSKKRL